jgi:KDO2-lipid IV(A) lauroyltransferase
MTQMLAYELEELVRQAPEQWHLFQPNWPSDPGFGA